MKNIMTVIFAMLATASTFVGCEGDKEDKAPATEEVKCDPACTENQECKLVEEKATCVEKVVEEVKCDPACDVDKQECKLVEDKPACVDKVPVVEELECSETKPCTDDKVCKEGKCEAKPEEPTKPESKCEPGCKDDEKCTCDNAEPPVCACTKKEPVVEESECSDTKLCEDGKVCKEGKCEVKVNPCDNKCSDEQCVCDNAEPPVCACTKKEPAVEDDPCKGKNENDECGENKICDKDGKCVDKVVEEPTKPEQDCEGDNCTPTEETTVELECSESKPCDNDKVCKEGKCEEPEKK